MSPHSQSPKDNPGGNGHGYNDEQLNGTTEHIRHLRRYSPHIDEAALKAQHVSRLQRHGSSHGHAPFRPLPAPTGMPPYRLDLTSVLSPDEIEDIKSKGLVFHTTGDTGGVKKPDPQKLVARQMAQDLQKVNPRPAFFYHLGDVVYFYGAAEEYHAQFYEPYEPYNAPIFAIPGNHDGDLAPKAENDNIPSLQAFVNNFCQSIPHHTREALDEARTGMTQPNVYWTLKTPLVTIIGLYTNVPEGGLLDDSQITWLQEELKSMKGQGPLIVAMHHPIYSLESIHSGSVYMGRILDEAIQLSGRVPDLVLAGHVHNYQRFTRQHKVGGVDYQVPYIVAGAGGYHNLHYLPADIAKAQLPYTDASAKDVKLEAFRDRQYGFLRLEITPDQKKLTGYYTAVPGFQDANANKIESEVVDSFEVDLSSHKIAGKALAGAR